MRCPIRSISISTGSVVQHARERRAGERADVSCGIWESYSNGAFSRALTLVGESDRKMVKQAMRSAPIETIKQRTVPPEMVKEAAVQLEKLEKDVEAVMEQETEEKMVSVAHVFVLTLAVLTDGGVTLQLRRAEMELKKSENMIEHDEEIRGRPARTWFQSKSDKRKAKGLLLSQLTPCRRLGLLKSRMFRGWHAGA
jgi:hypothetical protein